MPNAEAEIALLAENSDFAVFHKPPGLETVSEGGGPELLGPARARLGDPGLRPVHRLDRDTSGVQILARNAEAAQELNRLFRARRIAKTYLALCLGAPRNPSGTINRGLSPWSGGRRPVRVVKGGGLSASTVYRVLALSGELAGGWRTGFLSFSPRQGRTHQIRVHAAALGHPILGDDQYGDRSFNRLARDMLGLTRQALHAWRLVFDWRGETVEAVSPPPADLRLAGERAGLRELESLALQGMNPAELSG